MKINYYVLDDYRAPGSRYTRENPSGLIRLVEGEGKVRLYRFAAESRWVEDWGNLLPLFYDDPGIEKITEAEAAKIIERWTGKPADIHLRDLPWEPGEEGVVIGTASIF